MIRPVLRPKGPAAPTIGLLSPCGWGNLGDAAIQEVVIAAIRTRWPNARIVAFTSNPRDTAERHGVIAHPLSGYAPASYSIAGRRLPRTAALVDRALQRLARIPGLRSTGRTLQRGNDFTQSEVAHWVLAGRWLRRMDLLIVSGGGQLDDFWGGTWGHPYVLWKWTALARAFRTPVVMLSVGLGTMRTRLAKEFIRQALVRISYRSYRDERTRAGVIETFGDACAAPVVPDLAFGLAPTASSRTRSSAGAVGISPIAYRDPRLWPVKDPSAYRAYVTSLATIVRQLTDAGRRVVLFSTDWGDRPVVDDIWRLAGEPAWVYREPAGTVDALLTALTQVDAVIASRLHGVILAQLAGCPVLAISYDWKVTQHMEEMAQAHHCLAIDAIDAGLLASALAGLERSAEAERLAVAERLAMYRRKVEDQFAELLG